MTVAGDRRDKVGQPAADDEPGSKLPGWKIESLDYPTFRLTLLAKIMDRLTIRLLAERGDISYAEWRAMARLAIMPKGGTVGQIADLAWVDKAEVSRAVGALESRGFVERQPNPKDRRTPLLFLTSDGQARYDAGIGERRRFHEKLLADFSSEELDQFDTLLERVGAQLMQMAEIPQSPSD
ncbi:MAG: MarR family winged helix-turn-helix transcriptional regulator [Sphingomonas sp.]